VDKQWRGRTWRQTAGDQWSHFVPLAAITIVTLGVTISGLSLWYTSRHLEFLTGRNDLIIVGSHGRTGLAHVLLGGVAERVIRHASCPVLVARKPKEKSGASLGPAWGRSRAGLKQSWTSPKEVKNRSKASLDLS